MSATQADITVFRNEVRTFSGQYVAVDDTPLDLTGISLTSSAKAQAGDASAIASATITVTNAALGLFTYSWDGADFAAYGNVKAECRLAYDLKIDDDVVLYGQIILKPGVTA